MVLRLLLAVSDQGTLDLMHELIQAALGLVPHTVMVGEALTCDALRQRVRTGQDDVVFLDWELAEAETPALVRELLDTNPQLRIVVLLPMQLRQYRQRLWNAGACSSIPKEYLDQEWVSSALCLMRRAMEREARLINQLQPHTPCQLDGHGPVRVTASGY